MYISYLGRETMNILCGPVDGDRNARTVVYYLIRIFIHIISFPDDDDNTRNNNTRQKSAHGET